MYASISRVIVMFDYSIGWPVLFQTVPGAAETIQSIAVVQNWGICVTLNIKGTKFDKATSYLWEEPEQSLLPVFSEPWCKFKNKQAKSSDVGSAMDSNLSKLLTLLSEDKDSSN